MNVVIVVDASGAARLEARKADEAARIAKVKAKGFVPDEVGPEIPEAPARGPVRMYDLVGLYPNGERGFAPKPAGFRGRKTLVRADSFDLMARKAKGHNRPAPFSPSQVAMGRFYRDLTEKHASTGMRCSSLESLSQRSSGGGGAYIDAVLRDRERLAQIHHRIGSGSALIVRRHRPSARGSRVGITDRRMVDMVCLEDATISGVLRKHGWSIKSDLIASLTLALCNALDRMVGDTRSSGVTGCHMGGDPVSIWDEMRD